MHSTGYKSLEFFIIFILVPVSFAIDYSFWLKLGIGLIGFIYVIYVLLKIEKEKFKIAKNLNWKSFWKKTISKLVVIALVSTIFVLITDRGALFFTMLNKPVKWGTLLFIYTFFSVYPQELIYRTFFFKRHVMYFNTKWLVVIVNAALFSLAHLFFKNTLVLVITFLGGLLFAMTYHKTKSTLLVSIEHAIYGNWLFTVGMGEMLGFPT